MSKIEELIAQHCPDGVEWKDLSSLCSPLEKGTLKRTELDDSARYPVINSGREIYGRYGSFNNEADAITIASRGEYAGYITYVEERFWAGGLCYPYRSKQESVLSTKFLFYCLKSQEKLIMDTLVDRGSIPALNKKTIDKFKIPVPPIEVQQEIVRVLDAMCELEAKLQAELEDREKQFEHYRNMLLSFDADFLDAAGELSTLTNTVGGGGQYI